MAQTAAHTEDHESAAAASDGPTAAAASDGPTVLSVDVGRKNLALCALRAGACSLGREDRIVRWAVTACEPSAHGIAACLDGMPWVAAADDVVIERQPNRNATMTRLQHYLEMYFAVRGTPVTVQDAKHKLAFAAATPWWPAAMADNWSYHTRKKLAVHTAAAFLQATPQDAAFRDLFAGTSKKDDLADSLLQGMAYCHNVRPLELHRRQVSARAAGRVTKVRPRAPTAKQQASGRLSKPNVVHFLKTCGTLEDARRVVAGNRALARAVDRHFGGRVEHEELMASLGLAS